MTKKITLFIASMALVAIVATVSAQTKDDVYVSKKFIPISSSIKVADADAISVSPTSALTSTDVQAALQELATGVGGSGDLLATNNLSELTSATDSRSNLGLGDLINLTGKTIVPFNQLRDDVCETEASAFFNGKTSVTLREFIDAVFFPSVPPAAPVISSFTIKSGTSNSYPYSDWSTWNEGHTLEFEYAITNTSKQPGDPTDATPFSAIQLFDEQDPGEEESPAAVENPTDLATANEGNTTGTQTISYDETNLVGSATSLTRKYYKLRVKDGTNSITSGQTLSIDFSAAIPPSPTFVFSSGGQTTLEVPFSRDDFTQDINWAANLLTDNASAQIYAYVSGGTQGDDLYSATTGTYVAPVDVSTMDSYPNVSNTTKTYQLQVIGNTYTTPVNKYATLTMEGYEAVDWADSPVGGAKEGYPILQIPGTSDPLPSPFEYGEYTEVKVAWNINNPGLPDDVLETVAVQKGTTDVGAVSQDPGLRSVDVAIDYTNDSGDAVDNGKTFTVTATSELRDDDNENPNLTGTTAALNMASILYKGTITSDPATGGCDAITSDQIVHQNLLTSQKLGGNWIDDRFDCIYENTVENSFEIDYPATTSYAVFAYPDATGGDVSLIGYNDVSESWGPISGSGVYVRDLVIENQHGYMTNYKIVCHGTGKKNDPVGYYIQDETTQ